MKQKLLEQIKAALADMKLVYVCDEQERIGVRFDDLSCMYRVMENAVAFRMYLLNKKAKPENRTAVLEYLNRVNLFIVEGHFMIDDSDDIMFYIYTDCAEEGGISDKRIKEVLHKALWAEKEYGEGLNRLLNE